MELTGFGLAMMVTGAVLAGTIVVAVLGILIDRIGKQFEATEER